MKSKSRVTSPTLGLLLSHRTEYHEMLQLQAPVDLGQFYWRRHLNSACVQVMKVSESGVLKFRIPRQDLVMVLQCSAV